MQRIPIHSSVLHIPRLCLSSSSSFESNTFTRSTSLIQIPLAGFASCALPFPGCVSCWNVNIFSYLKLTRHPSAEIAAYRCAFPTTIQHGQSDSSLNLEKRDRTSSQPIAVSRANCYDEDHRKGHLQPLSSMKFCPPWEEHKENSDYSCYFNAQMGESTQDKPCLSPFFRESSAKMNLYHVIAASDWFA